eukprot:TRINITY_DN10859_c0_g1_i1.p1 TRINITY_DN10859_c0_g1~~TRINITY_DN10859_c0_g1_i1.p1  ORF type:complete len:253 (-),score=44.84 TRINITY_DN10859_c0_g1_i1:53-811(-)
MKQENRGHLAFIMAIITTVVYILSLCTPWWYQKYHLPDNMKDAALVLSQNNLTTDSPFFDGTICMIDGRCINSLVLRVDSSIQWVFTGVLILMVVGLLPWMTYLAVLLHRKFKPRSPGRRSALVVTATLSAVIVLTALVLGPVGITYSYRTYLPAIYGDTLVIIPEIKGVLGLTWGMHAGWIFAILLFLLIIISLITGLAAKWSSVQQRAYEMDNIEVPETVDPPPTLSTVGQFPSPTPISKTNGNIQKTEE